MRLFGGLIVVFALFQGSASALESYRGEYGFVVCAVVVVALIAVQHGLFDRPWRSTPRALGLAAPAVGSIGLSAGVSCALLASFPLYAAVTDVPMSVVNDWPRLAIGIFAQAGVAEETLFRGYLFGHLRRTRPFWRAAMLSIPPFVAVHLWLFATMAWPIALAAVALSVVISFPLARLFDLGGSTIWAPAILHAVSQGAVKIIQFDDERAVAFPLIWMAACAILPMAVFLARPKSSS